MSVGYFVFKTSELPTVAVHVDHPWMWVVYDNVEVLAAGSDVCSSICAERAEKVAMEYGMPKRTEPFKKMTDELSVRIPPWRCPNCGGPVRRTIIDGQCYYQCVGGCK